MGGQLEEQGSLALPSLDRLKCRLSRGVENTVPVFPRHKTRELPNGLSQMRCGPALLWVPCLLSLS